MGLVNLKNQSLTHLIITGTFIVNDGTIKTFNLSQINQSIQFQILLQFVSSEGSKIFTKFGKPPEQIEHEVSESLLTDREGQ